jgi:hypothetical protein
MIAHARLAIVIGVWAAITWGGRIGLLAGDETLVAKARIAVSLGVAAVAVIGLAMKAPWQRVAVAAYSAVTLIVWSTSAVSVLGDPASSVPFKLVHLVLACVSITVAIVAWVMVVRRSGPEQVHRSGAHSQVGR